MPNPHPIQRPVEEKPFHQKDAIKSGLQGLVVGGSAGFFLSAVQNSLAKRNVGAWGVFTRSGGTIASLSTDRYSSHIRSMTIADADSRSGPD